MKRKWKAWMVVDRYGNPSNDHAACSTFDYRDEAKGEQHAASMFYKNKNRAPFRILRIEIKELRK